MSFGGTLISVNSVSVGPCVSGRTGMAKLRRTQERVGHGGRGKKHPEAPCLWECCLMSIWENSARVLARQEWPVNEPTTVKAL